MASSGEVTEWVRRLEGGDREVAQRLWEAYYRRLVGLARKRLGDLPRRAADEEDVALSAFDSFCRGAEAGRFPRLTDRDSLWRILVVMTARKASHLVRDETRQKRGGRAVIRSEADAAAGAVPALEQLLSREPTPELAACMAEQYRGLLNALADEELEAVVISRMEGYTVEEIARKLGYAPRSIKRKLQLVRSLWEKELES